MELDFAGAAVDVAVADLDRSEDFYTVLMGRTCDLRPRSGQCEWRLSLEPEIVLRLTVRASAAGHGVAAIGVVDLVTEHERLALSWPDLPEIRERPGVIAVLQLDDPDGNAVTLWQDLLPSRTT